MFKPIEKKSLADAVFEQLREQIVQGEIEPGDSLPAERGLSEMLGVNRGAVREALKRLEQARLIAIQQGGSTKVLDYEETAGTDLLAALLVRSDGSFNTEVIHGILEMRTALASDIARLAARRASDNQVAKIELIAKQMRENKSDILQLQDLSITMWRVLTDSAQNIAYRLALNSIEQSYSRAKSLLTQVLAEEFGDVERFESPVQAIKERDEEEAAYVGRQIASVGEKNIHKVLQMLTPKEDAK